MSFWRNPEFVRYVRAELRPARVLSSAVLALVICSLVGLSAWGSTDRNATREFFKDFYLWVMGIQYVVLIFWCATACGHAIARERELKTYDFLRTTRLTAWELIVGKTLGVPILAYFTVGCSLPVSVLLGMPAGYSLGTLIATYVLLLATALFVSVMSLWTSMLVEGSGARSVGLLAIIPVGLAFGFADTAFPDFGAMSIFPALWSLYGVSGNGPIGRVQPVIFGQPVWFGWLTLILYASFGAWFVLMLLRNIKKDPEQTRLLSRWQAIGFAAFLNLLFYAFLDPKMISPRQPYNGWISPAQLSTVVIVLNAVIFLAIGVAMLSPQEKLRVWWRKHAAGEETYLSESGPPWPWLIPAALIAYVMLAAEALSLYRMFPIDQWHLGAAALGILVFLVFAARDILFLQWAILTRMKRPIVKGFLFLWLYYTAAGIVASVLSIAGPEGGRFVSEVLTPYGALSWEKIAPTESPGIYIGLVIQIFVIIYILLVVSHRLRRPAIVPALLAG